MAQLLEEGLTAEQLNDDCLGRCLDKIAAYRVSQLYSEIAFEVAREKGLRKKPGLYRLKVIRKLSVQT